MYEAVGLDKNNVDAFSGLLRLGMEAEIKYNPFCVGIGLIEEGAPIAAAVGAVEDAMCFNLLSLCVDEGHRRQGVASVLMEYLCDRCLEAEVRTIFAEYPKLDWLEGLDEFLQEYGFEKEELGDCLYSVRLSELKNLAIFNIEVKNSNMKESVIDFESFPDFKLKAFAARLNYQGKPYLADLLELNKMDGRLSLVYTDKQADDIRAVLCASRRDGGVQIDWVYGNQKESASLLYLFRAFYEGLKREAKEDLVISMATVTPESRKLAEGILKDYAKVSEPWVRRWAPI